jgi:general secretion pathway protein L
MASILGLDLGSYSVKGMLTEVTLRGTQIKGFGEVRRGETQLTEALHTLLDQLFPPQSLHRDQVVTSLPGQSLVTHLLTLPFTEAKQIEAALPFEVEGQLPSDLSEVVFDYQLGAQADQKSELLVGVVRKEQLRELLEMLKQLEVNPRVVTHPALAYKNLIAAAPDCFTTDWEGAFAILDIGHERTTIAVGSKRANLEFARTFPGGGKALSTEIATEFAISFPEAEQWKETQGAIGQAVKGAGAERAARALLRGLQPVIRETRACLKASTARSRRSITQIYLCGGTAKLAGLDQQLSQELGIPATRLRLPPEVSSSIPPEAGTAAAQAYSLSARRPSVTARGALLNLRRGEFAFRGDFDYLRDKVGLMVTYAAVLVALLIASGIVRNSVLASRDKQMDALLCTLTQRVLGQCEKNYDRALNLLKGKESPAAIIPKLSAASLLAEVAQRIPTDLPVTFDRIEVDLDRVVLRGDTESSKQIDQIVAALKGFHCFKEIKEGKVEKSRDGQKVNFRLDLQVDCPDVGQTPPSG